MKIAECGGDSKQIHRLTHKLLISQNQQRLPSTDDDVLYWLTDSKTTLKL